MSAYVQFGSVLMEPLPRPTGFSQKERKEYRRALVKHQRQHIAQLRVLEEKGELTAEKVQQETQAYLTLIRETYNNYEQRYQQTTGNVQRAGRAARPPGPPRSIGQLVFEGILMPQQGSVPEIQNSSNASPGQTRQSQTIMTARNFVPAPIPQPNQQPEQQMRTAVSSNPIQVFNLPQTSANQIATTQPGQPIRFCAVTCQGQLPKDMTLVPVKNLRGIPTCQLPHSGLIARPENLASSSLSDHSTASGPLQGYSRLQRLQQVGNFQGTVSEANAVPANVAIHSHQMQQQQLHGVYPGSNRLHGVQQVGNLQGIVPTSVSIHPHQVQQQQHGVSTGIPAVPSRNITPDDVEYQEMFAELQRKYLETCKLIKPQSRKQKELLNNVVDVLEGRKVVHFKYLLNIKEKLPLVMQRDCITFSLIDAIQDLVHKKKQDREKAGLSLEAEKSTEEERKPLVAQPWSSCDHLMIKVPESVRNLNYELPSREQRMQRLAQSRMK